MSALVDELRRLAKTRERYEYSDTLAMAADQIEKLQGALCDIADPSLTATECRKLARWALGWDKPTYGDVLRDNPGGSGDFG